MKKTSAVLVGVAILAAAYTGASWYLGKRIESQAQSAAALANAQLQQHGVEGVTLQLQAEAYERGVFNSKARYVLTYERRADEDTPEAISGKVVFVNDISHGPLGPMAIARGQLMPGLAHLRTTLANEAQAARLFELTGDNEPLLALTRIGFDGTGHANWRLAGFDSEKEGERISFSGATLNGTLGADGKTMTARGSMANFSVETPDQSLAVHDVQMAGNTRAGQLGMGIGDSNVTIGSIELQPPGSPLVTLEKLANRATVSEEGKDIKVDVLYTADSISVGERDFGSVQFGFKADQLDGEALKGLSEQYSRLMEEISASESSEASDEALAAFDDALDRVRASQPVLSLDPVIWKNAHGESRANVTLKFRADPPEEATPAMPQLSMLESLQANVSIAQPMAIDVMTAMFEGQGMDATEAASMAATQVEWLARTAHMAGWGVVEGDRLTMSLSYADGKTLLNGREQSLDEVLPSLGLSVPGESDDLGLDDEPASPDAAQAMENVDPAAVVKMLQDEGYTVNLTRDAADEPLIEVTGNQGGSLRGKTSIEFYGCDLPAECDNMLLRAVYTMETPVDLQAVNDWNATNRWARAYRGDKGQAILEVDIEVQGGLGEQALDTQLFGFFELAEDLADTVGAPLH